MNPAKTVLILGANSDVAKECVKKYLAKGFSVMMASRNLEEMKNFVNQNGLDENRIHFFYFDATDFKTHKEFYENLPQKPHIVLYSAGFLVQNEEAFENFDKTFEMAKTNYLGAVSILNIIAFDRSNKNLERIIGLSSLSGVRGRKSNFVYGSTKSAFTQYLAGLRQELSSRKIKVNVFVLGYIDSKINAGLKLNQSLMMMPGICCEENRERGKRFCFCPEFQMENHLCFIENFAGKCGGEVAVKSFQLIF